MLTATFTLTCNIKQKVHTVLNTRSVLGDLAPYILHDKSPCSASKKILLIRLCLECGSD